MQDSLKAILNTFSETTAADFEQYLAQSKGHNHRLLDLQLLQLLHRADELSPDEMTQLLYGSTDKMYREAYYALRKRFQRKLVAFLALQALHEEHSPTGLVTGLLAVSRYLFAHNLPDLAWEYVGKAESACQTYELHKLMTEVLTLQIEYAHRQSDVSLDDILEKYASNKLLVEEENRVLIVHSVIRQRIGALQKQGLSPNFAEAVNDVLETHGLEAIELRRPKLLYEVVSAVRAQFLASKNFTSFEPYLLEKYEAMKLHGGFVAHHRYYHLQLLYFVAHILFRNRKFAEAQHYLMELNELLQTKPSEPFRKALMPRYTLLCAAIHCFSNHIKTAIQLLDAYIVAPESKTDSPTWLNAHLNLIGFYFMEKNYRKAAQLMREFPKKDGWCAKHIGREWLLKKHLLEVMLQVELGNNDIVIRRLKAIERAYADMIDTNRPAYNRARLFFEFIRRLLASPAWLRSPEIHEFFKQFVVRDNRREDTQALLFYAWMKSKIDNTDYYQTLLAILHQV